MTHVDRPQVNKLETRGNHSPVDVLRVFLKLGLISFGGPIAHIGYFRDEFVVHRRWLDDQGSEDCQGRALWALGVAVGRSPIRTFQMIALACAGLDLQLVISLGGGQDPALLGDLPGDPIVVGGRDNKSDVRQHLHRDGQAVEPKAWPDQN